MKNGIFSMLILLASITFSNFASAQYCTPLYGFETNSATNEVFSVRVDPENGSVYTFSEIEGSNGVITSALNINNKLMYYIESSIPRFLTVNSVTGEPLSSGIFNVSGLKELEYNCENEITYGFSEKGNSITLVSIDWQAEELNQIFDFQGNGVQSSAINAKGDLIFLVDGDNILHSYNISTNTASNVKLAVDVIEIEYDVNDNIIYAYLESGAFGSIEDGIFTQIGNEVPPQGEPISTAFDPFTNTFFIANNTTLVAIDTQTGDIVNEFNLSKPLHRLNAGIPCQIVADFYPDNTCIDLPVQFTDASIGATDWQWDFGDGVGTSTEQNPVYTYSTAGMYDVRLQVSGCELGIDDTTVVITITEQPQVDLGEDVMACGESYRIDPGSFDPSFDLRWTFGVTDPTFNVSRDGTYWLSVKNGGCFGTDTIEVTLIDAPEVDLGDDQSFCEAVDIELDAENPALDHTWSTGATTPTITVNGTGIYWVDVSNAACTTRDSVSIELLDALGVNLGDDVAICAESYELDAGISGVGIEYVWSNGATSQTTMITESGTYSVEVSSGNCTATDEINVNFSNNVTVSLGEDINACDGESIVLDAGDNGDNYLWSDGSTNQTIEVSESGEYSVEIENGECNSIASIQVTFNETPTVNLPTDIIVCNDTTITLSGPVGNNYTYVWSSGETTQTISPAASGNYSLTVSNTGCSSEDNINVTINPLPEIDLGEDQKLCVIENDMITLNAGAGFVQYSWSVMGAQSESIEVNVPGIYTVTVEDENGCINNDEVIVTEQCAAKIYVPNAFSPNGDAQNDTFKPTVKFVENYAFKIFNRYGQTVFSTTDMDASWDGFFQNLKQPVGVFSWALEYTAEGGETQKQKGNVTLIR